MGIFDFFKKKENQSPTISIDGKRISFDDKTKANLQIDQQALTAYEAKDYNKALELYSQLIDKNPTAHQYYQFRGTVYEDMGNDVMAQQDFEKSISIDPQNTTSLYRLAMVYHRKNDLKQAIFYLKKAYNILSANDEMLGKEFGYKDFMDGSYNNILMVHKRVIAFNLANFLVQTNRVEEGTAILDELIKYCPTYSYPYFVKALVLVQNQQIEKGLELAKKAAKYGHPQSADLVNQLTSLMASYSSSGDRYTNMVNNATFNPFKITCDPRYQNSQNLPNLQATFSKELNDLYQKLGTANINRQILVQMSTGYVFNLVESYYNNAGYVPKNSLDQILEQVYNAMQHTGFISAFSSLDDFKYNCYYGFLNR